MSEETGQTAEEKKSREAAEEASALNKLTDRVSILHTYEHTLVLCKCSVSEVDYHLWVGLLFFLKCLW